jgi:2-succinyl-5-enolpyruvyl-6-hydroxy-3-cyclohexene-1-carboxylate synthase
LAQAGAAQTIDQAKLFGTWPRLFVDLGDPSPEPSALEGVARQLAQAVASCCGERPGPVHVDLHADKPLEPIEAASDAECALVLTADALTQRGLPTISVASRGPDETFARALVQALSLAKRPLVVAGPRSGDSSAIREACASLELVIAAEATSQLRFGPRLGRAIDASEVMFASAAFANANVPDLILQIGSLPTAPTLERAWKGTSRFVIDAGGIHDPLGGAAAISTAPAGATLQRVAELAPTSMRERAWEAALIDADALAWSAVERSIASGRGEGPVVRAAVAASSNATIVVGNSLPIRTLDRFVPGGGVARRVISQRGANGIDGLVSGAIGVAIAEAAPVLAIVGDVSFLHDLNALTALGTLRSPLVVVVVDNGGGRIFESLPIARLAVTADAMPLFTTPHGVDLAAATRAFGVTCVECVDARETAKAVTSAMASPHATVVRAIVDPHDAFDAFAALTEALDAQLSRGAT